MTEIAGSLRDIGIFFIGVALLIAAAKYAFAPKSELEKMQDALTKTMTEEFHGLKSLSKP